MRALTKLLPEYDYLYLGDHARAPYGPRSKEEIYQFALQGVEELFRRGCEIVIFACNTAAANALREIQQEVLPKKYPHKRVLGILVPTVEQLTGIQWGQTTPSPSLSVRRGEDLVVGILATEATVRSGAYTREIQKRRPEMIVLEQACPELSPLIEAGATEEVIRETAQKYVRGLFAQRKSSFPPITSVLLGCTHYELVADLIAGMLPKGVNLYAQSAIVAESLRVYLERHPEMRARLSATGQRHFLTTGDASEVSRLGTTFFGATVNFEHIELLT